MKKSLLKDSDRCVHIGPPLSTQPEGSEEAMVEDRLRRLIPKRHLGVNNPENYMKDTHVYYPNKIAGQLKDQLRVGFMSWNSGSLNSRHRRDSERVMRLSLNHEIALLQEVDPSGPMSLAAQLDGPSSATGGHASGLAQFQSTRGIGCSMNYWPPEHERSGCLYRAFMNAPVCDPSVMKTHFSNAQRRNGH